MLGKSRRIAYVAYFDCRVMSVKGKKVLHIDRNDHYGGLVEPLGPPKGSVDRN